MGVSTQSKKKKVPVLPHFWPASSVQWLLSFYELSQGIFGCLDVEGRGSFNWIATLGRSVE